MKLSSLRVALCTLAVFVGSALSGFSQSTTWNALVGSTWSPGTWTNGFPTSSTDVFIRRTALTSVTVQSGLNAEAANVFIGQSGFFGSDNGRLTIASGGSLTTSGNTGVVVGNNGNTGELIVRGLLATRQISKGTGSASVEFDGGTLRALEGGVNLIQGFAAGQVVIENPAGPAIIGLRVDTNNLEISINSPLSGSGGLGVEGFGILTLGGTNTYSGGTYIAQNTILRVGANANLGAASGVLSFNDGILNTTASFSMSRATTLEILGGVYDVDAGTTLTHTGVHSGSGQLDKSGGGTLVLTGSNTFTGGTVITDGTLQVGNNGLSGTLGSGDVQILQDGTLAISRSNPTLLLFTFSNNVSGDGQVRITGSGTVSLSGANTYSGGTELLSGILFAQNDQSLGTGALTISGGGRLSYGNGVSLDNEIVLESNAELSVLTSLWEGLQNGVISENGGPRNVSKVGTGTLIFAADNTYTGTTTVSAGTLQLGDGGSTGSVAGDIQIQGGTSLILYRDNLLDLSSQSISGSGSVFQVGSGTTTLGNNAGFSGDVFLEDGVLVAANAASLGSGSLFANFGSFRPDTLVSFDSIFWDDAFLVMDLNGGSQLSLSGAFDNAGFGGQFQFANLTPGTTYTLATFNSSNFLSADDFTAFSSNPDVELFGTFTFDASSQLQYTFFGASATGAVLQNSNPVDIPAVADFFVNGPVSTGSPLENNTIRSLTFASGSSLRVFNTLTNTSGIFNVLNGRATVSGGNVFSPGGFTKTGSGTLDVQSNFGVGGAATINAGALLVNGNFTVGGGLRVLQNALLGGSGIIRGNVFNQGTVSPGNSPGTLVILGNFTQAPSGNLLIEAASLSNFDRLVVSGTASLAGTLQFQPLNGFRPKYGQQFAFLQAGNITGNFDSILVPAKFRGRFLNNGNEGILLLAPDTYTRVASNQNQFNVAQALDSFIPQVGNDQEVVSTALDLLSEEQYPAAFDQIMPAFHESVANVGINLAQTQGQLMLQQLSMVRLGGRGFRLSGMPAQPLTNDLDGKRVSEPKSLKSEVPMDSGVNRRWATWAQGNGVFAKATSAMSLPNYRFESGGFLAGADYAWNESFVTGLFAGYQGAYARYGNGSDLRMNGVRFGGYATYDAPDNGFYLDGSVWGGASGYTTRRKIQFSILDRTARANQQTGELSALMGTGYDWQIGNFTFGPSASAQYTYFGIAPFTESGADSLNLRVGQQNSNSLQTYLGGRVAYTARLSESILLIPEVRMFWQHEFLNNPRTIQSALDGGASPWFGYRTQAPGRDAVWAGAGAALQFGDRVNTFVYYNADFGSQDYISHVISAGLGLSF